MLNKGIFFGHSSRLGYDTPCYNQTVEQSVSPLLYKLDPTQMNNCNGCLSVFGPRTSMGPRSYGVSTVVGKTLAPALDLTDIDSIMSNRNVINSKCRDGKVNTIDLNSFKLQHAVTCNDFMDPIASHLTDPPQNYRGMSINRFYNLPKNPQVNIYWDGAVNTKLEARDNYFERVPRIAKYDPTLPVEYRGSPRDAYIQTGLCPQ